MKVYVYILLAAGVSFLLRVLPLTVIRKKFNNKFLRSFLYYVPYVTLAIMTFPAIVTATNSYYAGALALLAGITAAWFGVDMFLISAICCVVAFLVSFITFC